MKVLVTGSRSWRDEAPIRARLEQLPPCSFVIHGGARGVDRMAAVIAQQLGHAVRAFPADWRVKADTPAGAIRTDGSGRRYDSRAGLRRNLLMLDQEPDVVLAWWDGRSTGTKHCIEAAIERGILVEVA